MSDHLTLQCTVSDKAGAYVTNTVRGKRASCTSSGVSAANALGFKIFGPGFSHAEWLANEAGKGRYKLHSKPVITAWCRTDGSIGFGPMASDDEGLIFSAGPDGALQEIVAVCARHGHSKADGRLGPLLVPGVPESEDHADKADALRAWMQFHAHGNGGTERFGVIFGCVTAKAAA